MTPRVCHISTVHVPNDVRVFHRECRSLVDAGYEVHLVIPAASSGTVDGVHVHPIRRIQSRPLRILLMPWVALRVALKTRATLFHYHDPELLPVGFVLRRLLGKRVVYDIHEAVPRQILGKSWLPRRSRRIAAAAYSFLERLLVPGQSMVLANEGWAPCVRGRTHLVRNYPQLNGNPVRGLKPVSQRAQPPLLVYVGGVSPERGGDRYVALARALAERGHGFRMMLIGGYAEAYGRHLKRRIAEKGLAERVTLTGRLDHAEALRHVGEATLGLCLLQPIPNYTTCLATKILEYMMLGTPVLASDFDVWRPYVTGTRAGVMCDPCKDRSIVEACEHMLADPGALNEMGRLGAEAVRERFNWSSEFAELLRCYTELLAPDHAAEWCERGQYTRVSRAPG